MGKSQENRCSCTCILVRKVIPNSAASSAKNGDFVLSESHANCMWHKNYFLQFVWILMIQCHVGRRNKVPASKKRIGLLDSVLSLTPDRHVHLSSKLFQGSFRWRRLCDHNSLCVCLLFNTWTCNGNFHSHFFLSPFIISGSLCVQRCKCLVSLRRFTRSSLQKTLGHSHAGRLRAVLPQPQQRHRLFRMWVRWIFPSID